MALRIAIVVFLSSWSLFVQPAKGSQLLHRLLYNTTLASYNSLTGTTFSSLDEIHGNGSLLVNVSPDDGITGQFVLFPNMRFNCSGRITKVKFLALRTPKKLDINFGVGRLKRDDNSYQVKHWPVNNVREGRTLFEQHFLRWQMKYEPGDVFAFKQVDSLLMYNTDNTIERLRCSGPRPGQIYKCVTGHGYQPLVTIETGNNK